MGWFGKWFGVKKYQHINYSRIPTADDLDNSFPFIAGATQVVDSIRIMLGNSGNVATVVTLRFVDAAQNRQVGNIKEVSLGASAAYAANTVSGFATALQKFRSYRLEVLSTVPDANGLLANAKSSAAYSVNVQVGGFAYGAIAAPWRIGIDSNWCIPMGGTAGFQAAGDANRTLNMTVNGAATPAVNGIYTISDIVPAGTSLTVNGYYTNSDGLAAASGVAGWSAQGAMASGDVVPPAKYWRFVIDMTSNATQDETPSVSTISVSYLNDPLVFGTHAQRLLIEGYGNSYDQQAVKAIHDVSASSSALEAKAKKMMIGQMTIDLAPEEIVEGLFARKLRGKRVMIRAGYADVPDTILFYEGIVRDLAFQKSKYILTVLDTLELIDVSLPRDRHPLWNGGTAYIAGNIVTYGNKSYLCLVGNTGVQPDTDPAKWQENGTVWIDIVFTAGTHLCDIAKDLLENHINISSDRIDIASIDAVKAAQPALTIAANRTISVQEKALSMLSEISWLLASHWTISEGRLKLIQEADTTVLPVEYVTGHDIKETLEYRRGWADLKNECLILSQYVGTGEGSAQFENGIAIADATSIQDHQLTALHEFQDKWGLSEANLTTIGTTFVNRWKNGRRILRFDASMRLLPVETGDVINVKSAQLPEGDISQMNGMVIGKDIDWLDQSLKITVLEVT